MRIDGPPRILDALKEYLKSCGVGCRLKRDRLDGSIRLKVRPGASPEHVRRLLDEWTT
jgi:hypothetical protein